MNQEENPYRSPEADLSEPIRQDPHDFTIPKIYFRRKLTVTKWKHVLRGTWENEYESTTENVRLKELGRDGSYHHLLLGDFWNGIHLQGANEFQFDEEGNLTFRNFNDYPWPLYSLRLQKNLIDRFREKYDRIVERIFECRND